MSHDGLEIVKRGIAAYNAGDMDAMMRTYATDVEAFPDASAFPDAHPCHGRAEFRTWLEESATAWTKPSWVVTEAPAVDSERVLVRGNWGGQGVASGLVTAASITGIFAVRDAQVSRVEFFVDHQKALEAVGWQDKAVSQASMETLRQAVDAVNRRDKALWRAACDPEIENIPPRDWPESEPTRGPDAIWDFYVEAMDSWGAGIYEYSEITEVSHDDLVAHIRGELRGKLSGAPVTWNFWQVVKMRNGTAVRIEWFTDRSEALKAVGLAE